MVKRRQTRRKTTRRKYKAKGGAISCTAVDGFTDEMIRASGGRNYVDAIAGIHEKGTEWSCDQFKLAGQNGIIQWWINKLRQPELGGIVYSPAERETLRDNEDLNKLSAFYHRFKIVIENLDRVHNCVQDGLASFYPDEERYREFTEFTGPSSFQSYIDYKDANPQPNPLPSKRREMLQTIASGIQSFYPKFVLIGVVVNKVQCLMFYVVKHKGQFPDGYVMDPRIESLACQPISAFLRNGCRRGGQAAAISDAYNWFSQLERLSNLLTAPPVTFGTVFDE